MQDDQYITFEGKNPVEVEEPELHHYTDWSGLSGIWKSQMLFGTRYDCLNDITEVTHLEKFFQRHLEIEIKDVLSRKMSESLEIYQAIIQQGGLLKCVKQDAHAIVSGLYKNTFSITDAFAVPYITSFCTHKKDHAYEQENGLLSQWRGYAGQETYAIVFDTIGIVNCITNERKAYDYSTIGIMDVIYDDEEFDFPSRFAFLLNIAASKYERVFEGEELSQEQSIELFHSFITAAARFKHRGFKEEKEVRIVSFLSTANYTEAIYKRKGISTPNIKYKPTHNNGKRIYLFEGNNPSLPIKRIIVGPHKDKNNLAEKVKEMVEDRVPVIVSETPFIKSNYT
jgi:hypothetical protein